VHLALSSFTGLPATPKGISPVRDLNLLLLLLREKRRGGRDHCDHREHLKLDRVHDREKIGGGEVKKLVTIRGGENNRIRGVGQGERESEEKSVTWFVGVVGARACSARLIKKQQHTSCGSPPVTSREGTRQTIGAKALENEKTRSVFRPIQFFTSMT